MNNIILTVPASAEGLQPQRAVAWLATTLLQIGNPEGPVLFHYQSGDAFSNN